MNKNQLKESIIIVIERDGSHHVRLPDDDELEFSQKAYTSMMNTMIVLDEPSFVLKVFLWLERGMRGLSKAVFG
jgi:hypothetical protein